MSNYDCSGSQIADFFFRSVSFFFTTICRHLSFLPFNPPHATSLPLRAQLGSCTPPPQTGRLWKWSFIPATVFKITYNLMLLNRTGRKESK